MSIGRFKAPTVLRPTTVTFGDDTELEDHEVELGPFNVGVVVESTQIAGEIRFMLIDVATSEEIAHTLIGGPWIISGYSGSFRQMFISGAHFLAR